MGRFGCQEIEKFVHVFVDGEFDEADRREFEVHLAGCESCRNVCAFEARFRRTLRLAVPRPQAPAALRERLLRELACAPEPESSPSEDGEALPRRSWLRSFWRSFPLSTLPVAAAAAAVVVALGWSQRRTPPAVVAESVSFHRRTLPVEVTGPDVQSVRSWFHGKVDFPVRPPRFARRGRRSREVPSLVGGRLSHIASRQAAYLVYDVGGSKLSVMMFPAEGMPLEGARRRRIGGREIYLDNRNGYQVALLRDRGVGYAITGDIDEQEMVRLLEAAFTP